MHQSVIYDQSEHLTVAERSFADDRRKRLARIERRAYRPAPPAVTQIIEIVECEPVETTIEVTACNGQIVLVTEKQIAEARAIFEQVNTFGGTKVSIDQIQRAVCKKFNVTLIDMLSMRRTKELVVPRQVAMYLSKVLTFKSLPEIGRRFNGKDHTTVLHAVRKMATLVKVDETIRAVVTELQTELGMEAD